MPRIGRQVFGISGPFWSPLVIVGSWEECLKGSKTFAIRCFALWGSIEIQKIRLNSEVWLKSDSDRADPLRTPS